MAAIQVAHVGAQAGTAAQAARAPAPEEPPGAAVPADDGLGPDQKEMPPPVAAEAAGHDPQQFVAGADRGMLARQDGQLVAQQHVLG
jgi:hypothetical protein